jgi:hypothetical protein
MGKKAFLDFLSKSLQLYEVSEKKKFGDIAPVEVRE